jgi:hypothetical protein
MPLRTSGHAVVFSRKVQGIGTPPNTPPSGERGNAGKMGGGRRFFRKGIGPKPHGGRAHKKVRISFEKV